jgi:DNA-binding response OmpR family regulator
MNERWDVLIVDDERVVRDAVARILQSQGWRAVSVADAEAALAHPALSDCRLVICDLMLPGGSGLEVVRSMRRSRPELPILVITGLATEESRAGALRAGATDYLAKPFDDVELLTLVRHAMAEADVAGKEGTS